MFVAGDDKLGETFDGGLDVLVVIGISRNRMDTEASLDGSGDQPNRCNPYLQIFL